MSLVTIEQETAEPEPTPNWPNQTKFERKPNWQKQNCEPKWPNRTQKQKSLHEASPVASFETLSTELESSRRGASF